MPLRFPWVAMTALVLAPWACGDSSDTHINTDEPITLPTIDGFSTIGTVEIATALDGMQVYNGPKLNFRMAVSADRKYAFVVNAGPDNGFEVHSFDLASELPVEIGTYQPGKDANARIHIDAAGNFMSVAESVDDKLTRRVHKALHIEGSRLVVIFRKGFVVLDASDPSSLVWSYGWSWTATSEFVNGDPWFSGGCYHQGILYSAQQAHEYGASILGGPVTFGGLLAHDLSSEETAGDATLVSGPGSFSVADCDFFPGTNLMVASDNEDIERCFGPGVLHSDSVGVEAAFTEAIEYFLAWNSSSPSCGAPVTIQAVLDFVTPATSVDYDCGAINPELGALSAHSVGDGAVCYQELSFPSWGASYTHDGLAATDSLTSVDDITLSLWEPSKAEAARLFDLFEQVSPGLGGWAWVLDMGAFELGTGSDISQRLGVSKAQFDDPSFVPTAIAPPPGVTMYSAHVTNGTDNVTALADGTHFVLTSATDGLDVLQFAGTGFGPSSHFGPESAGGGLANTRFGSIGNNVFGRAAFSLNERYYALLNGGGTEDADVTQNGSFVVFDLGVEKPASTDALNAPRLPSVTIGSAQCGDGVGCVNLAGGFAKSMGGENGRIYLLAAKMRDASPNPEWIIESLQWIVVEADAAFE